MSAEVPTIPTEAAVSAGNRTMGRRRALALFAGASVAVVVGACSGEPDYNPDLGLPTDPAWLEGTPSPAESSPSSRATEHSSQGDPAEASPSPSHREVIEPAGERLEVEWRSVRNRELADEIRRRGKDIDGDSQVGDDDDRRYLRSAAVFAAPVDAVEGEPLHLALASPDETSPDADKVRYVRLPWDKFPQSVRAEADNGDIVQAYPFRLGMEGAPDTVAFVSGRISEGPEGWKVETTLRTHPGTSITNGSYSNAPLV